MHNERSSESSRRSVALPSNVDASSISSVFKAGVLEVTAPKAAGASTRRRIPVA